MLEESFMRIQKTVPFIKSTSTKEQPHWVFLHGYAQDVQTFSKPFIENYKNFANLYFPQAPSHFYQKGTKGEMAASWMTKHNRTQDIHDQIDYLAQFVQENIPSDVKVSFFGFSQGAPVAARIAEYMPIRLNRLVLWSGNIDPSSLLEKKNIGKISCIEHIHGNKDKFAPLNIWQEYFQMLDSAKIQYTKKIYDGGHFFDASLLKKLFTV